MRDITGRSAAHLQQSRAISAGRQQYQGNDSGTKQWLQPPQHTHHSACLSGAQQVHPRAQPLLWLARSAARGAAPAAAAAKLLQSLVPLLGSVVRIEVHAPGDAAASQCRRQACRVSLSINAVHVPTGWVVAR